jgi:hypothetical protein
MMALTPFTVARAQLLTSIELHLSDRDPVSVQSLAGNARELLEGLCRLGGFDPFAESVLLDDPGRGKKWLYGVVNLYRNCFKHLGDTEEERADDQRTLDQFNDRVNDFLIYICVEDYLLLRSASPVPLQVFQVWFCALNADLIFGTEDRAVYKNAFPNIGTLTRSQQKLLTKEAITRYSNDPRLLMDSRTEPLVIDE